MNTAHASHPVTIEKLNEIWFFKAGPLFKEFTTLLADPENAIPTHFLQPKWEMGLKWNHLFKFLRPQKVAGLFELLDTLPFPRRQTLAKSIIKPYINAWNDLITALGAFYIPSNTAGVVLAEFCNMMRACEFLGTENLERHRDFRPSLYAKTFDAFCLAFAGLPTESGIAAKKIEKGVGKVLSIAKAKAHAAKKAWRTQTDVAKDFGVSKQTVITWEKGPDCPNNKTNKWRYYKSLRTDPDLEDAYKWLLKKVNLYKALVKADPKHPFSFTHYSDEYDLKHLGKCLHKKN